MANVVAFVACLTMLIMNRYLGLESSLIALATTYAYEVIAERSTSVQLPQLDG